MEDTIVAIHARFAIESILQNRKLHLEHPNTSKVGA